MLKNLFNNPWFIGALGVFASIYLGWAIAKPIFFDDTNDIVAYEEAYDSAYDDYDEEYDEEDGYENTASSENKSYALEPVDREAVVRGRQYIGWLHDVERDPFANSPLAIETVTATELPKVEALFLSNGVQAAVIENRLVHVGDMVAQYKVTEIGKDFVRVSRFGKQFRLEPKAG